MDNIFMPGMADIQKRQELFDRAYELTEQRPLSEAAAYGIIYTNNFAKNHKYSYKLFKKYTDRVRNELKGYIKASTNVDADAEEMGLRNIFAIWADYLLENDTTGLEFEKSMISPVYESVFRSENIFTENKDMLEGSLNEATKKVVEELNHSVEKNDKKGQELRKMASDELDNCIIDYISEVLLRDKSINQSNFVSKLPDQKDCLMILSRFNTMLAYDIERYMVRNAYQMIAMSEFEHIKKKIKEKMDIQMTQYNDILKTERNDNAELIKENKKLRDELSEMRRKSDSEELLSRLEEQERAYNKLENKYNELKSKYDEIKAEKSEIKVDEKKEEEQGRLLSEEEKQLKYAFVIDNWTSFHAILKEEYPNAEFITKSDTVMDKGIYDLVILMPFHLGHNHYYNIKKQCKRKEIPFTHYNSTNLEGLQKQIAEALDKR